MNCFGLIYCYIGVLSLLAVIACCYDKLAAINGWRRVRESRLLMLAACGGASAMFLTMNVIRHKTRHFKFMFFVPLFALVQIALIVMLRCTV